MKTLPASGLVLLWMKATGFRGLTTPWQTIYLHPDNLTDAALIKQEQVHIAQIQRDGAFVFSAKYVWWSLRFGYWNNPYEVEARK